MNPVATAQKARAEAYRNISDPILESLDLHEELARILQNRA